MLSNNAQKWLESFLQDYFGVPITLKKIGNSINLNVNDICFVKFDHFNSDFYRIGKTELNCGIWNPEEEGFRDILKSGIYSPGYEGQKIFELNKGTYYCHFDILGLIYWCLNRLEEIGAKNLDKHERYNYFESHAYKYNYIEYPIVDQWLDIVKQLILKIDPTITLKENKFEVVTTHDVDRPYRYFFSNLNVALKSALVDLIKHKSFLGFLMVGGKFFNKKNIFKLDPYNTFNWLMEKSEKNNLKSRFYFICGGKTKFDANYSVNNYVIKKLINQIKRRGHEVGIHPSYGCYLNPEQIQYEVTELKNIIGPEHKIGARMHYLRFKYPETLIYLNDANVEYDSTLGYAEHIGFRCGTSHEYTPFNPITQQSLSIKVLPLILMEGTLYHYMNLSLNEKTLNRVLLLKKRCQFFNGNFTILWHNSELRSFKQRKFYESIISS